MFVNADYIDFLIHVKYDDTFRALRAIKSGLAGPENYLCY